MGRILPQTEAFVEYHHERERRIRAVQTSNAAFWTLERVVGDATGDTLLGHLVDASRGVRPEGKRFVDPVGTVEEARKSVARLGVVHEFSAFERFLRISIVDAVQFSASVAALPEFEHEHEAFETSLKRCGGCQDVAWKFVGDHSVTEVSEAVSASFGLTLGPTEALLPLMNYFWHARNRIAHADGYCGERLAEYIASPELQNSVAAWNKTYSKRAAPPLPATRAQERLVLLGEHAILCGAACHRVARAITTNIVAGMGERAMLLMAIYYAYFAPSNPHRALRHTQPDQAVGNFLVRRYRYALASKTSLIPVLRKHGLWDLARAGFQHLYASSS